MPRADVVVSSKIEVTPRVLQLRGVFDVPPAPESRSEWHIDLPLEEREWSVGLIVGPSGAGKSTLARHLFGESIVSGFEWPDSMSIVDGFDAELSIADVTGILSSVGFSSPPSWLRPYRVLSTGEKFRVDMARALSEGRALTVVDEFTSVVDRTVAQIGSAAIARAVRSRGRRFVAVGCHYDVIDWLQPDWVLEPHVGKFVWRSLQRRPAVELEIRRTAREAWELFAPHHYLSGDLNRAARCFVALWGGRPCAFTAILSMPHATVSNAWREHRTVCLPDFQGVGIGNAMSDAIGSVVRGCGGQYYSRTTSPGMIASRRRSKHWTTTGIGPTGKRGKTSTSGWTPDELRRSVGFRYVGPAAASTSSTALWLERP